MGHIPCLVVALCVLSCVHTLSIEYADFLMQSDPQGSFGEFVDKSQSEVPKGCGGKPADVYFVMDSSRDVTQAQIDKQKKYIKELSTLFYLDLDTVRLGVISSGTTPLTAIRLGLYKTREEFRRAVDIVPRVGGQKDIAQTLDFLRQKAFAPRVARQHVAHVVIYLTNGFSENAKLTMSEGHLLKKKGVYVYTVNLGGKWDKSELTAMASTPAHEFIFSSDDYSIVRSLIEVLRIHECAYQVHPPEEIRAPACSPRRPVDMVFGVDHLSIGAENSKRILAFISSLFSDFSHDGNLNTAVLLSRPILNKDLNYQLSEVKITDEQLSSVAFPEFSNMLRRTRRILYKGRQSVQKTAVIFVDSSVRFNQAAFKEAKRNKYRKIETYIVFIGDSYNKSDLELLSTGMNNVIIVPSYHELQIAREDVIGAICKGL